MKEWKTTRLFSLFRLGLLLTLCCAALVGQELQIHYINVQQGQSTLIVGPDGTTILYDGGYETKGTTELVPYLQSLGITGSLDYIIASHQDTDHFVGLTETMNAGYSASVVYYNGSDKTNTYVSAFFSAAAAACPGGAVPLPLGTVIPLGYGATATCVAVNGSVIGSGAVPGGTDNENDRAVCLLIQYGEFDYLVTGDIGGGADDYACTGRNTSQVNIESPLVMSLMPAGAHPLLSEYGLEIAHIAHHGSESSGNADYMNILTPRLACISVGAGQDASYRHPRIDVVEHVFLAQAPCITAPAALVLQTEEGAPIGDLTSTAGYSVGDIVVSTDGVNSYTVSANGAVTQGPDERAAAGLPATFYFEEYSAADNAPVIYNSHSENITTIAADIAWSTNETASSLVRYGTASGSYPESVGDASLSLNHALTLTNLLEATTYYYVVESSDATGHTTTSSEYSFTTTGTVADTVTVTSPNGGESWVIGSSHTISWSSTGLVGNLNIDYSIDSGASWISIAADESNDGSYSWTVPDSVSASCLVRVQESDGSPSDTSDAAFTISLEAQESLTVTAPNGGESWGIGSSKTVSWSSTGAVGNLDIDYSVDNGLNWTNIALGETNDGSYTWTVPDNASTSCLLRIQDEDGSPSDVSDAVFSIAQITPAAGVKISEVYYDTVGTDSIEEWIELYNTTTEAVDIGGFSLSDNNGTGGSYTIPAGTIIAPKSYLTVAANSAGFTALYGYSADLYYGTVMALGNSGDSILLRDSLGGLVDAVAYEGGTSGGIPDGWGSSSLPVATTGNTIVRADLGVDTDTYADWTTASGNGFPQTRILSAPVIFSEVYYDTVGTDSVEEWIELYNRAPIAVDIGGCTITDNNGVGGGTYTIPAGTLMAPNSHLTVAANNDGFVALYGYPADLYYGTVLALGNSGDALLLKDSQGILRDTVAYEGGTTSGGVPAGWGSDSEPSAPTGSSIVRVDLSVDTDSYIDWTTAAGNGNPQNQADLLDLITLTSPNGGESRMVGAELDITWTTVGTVGAVDIDYSTDNGANWLPIIAGSANDGLYSWIVPDTISASCLVRVREFDGSPSDVSDAVFSIIAYIPELVTASSVPAGPTGGLTGTTCEYSTDGAVSNYGDPVQYRFDWGDGTDSGWLAVGTLSATHSWTGSGRYEVKAQARCAAHSSIESAWSAVLSVDMVDAVPDFDMNGQVDILWRNTLTGQNRVWLMDGLIRTAVADLDPQSGLTWTIAGCADFNGDRKADILWRNVLTGRNRVWLMDGVSRSSVVELEALGNQSWVMAGCADFNGDRKADILWRNILTGKNRVWIMDGVSHSATVELDAQTSLLWTIAGCADFDGDHKTDILWRNLWSGENQVWLMDGTSRSATANLDAQTNRSWVIAGCADFDGDLKTDILWRKAGSGENSVWLMDGLTRIGTAALDPMAGAVWVVGN